MISIFAPPIREEKSPLAPLAKNNLASGSLHVVITREPFSDYFELKLDNGHTEELDPEETRAWFKERGADMDNLEKVLDTVWNFQYADVVLDNYREPVLQRLPHTPDI